MRSRFEQHTLPNGLRVICEVMPRVRSAALAFFVQTGSRHEHPHQHGVSHFLEHMCFKGTQKRDWRAINVRFDELGSIYNAFTGKEHTVYYGWVPGRRTDEQLELLADMMRPSLPADDFETERKVILEEIAMSGDSFEHHVSNFLHEVVFAEHPLGHEILGEAATIAELPREEMQRYHAARYAPRNMVLLATGAVDPDAVFRTAEQLTTAWNGNANGGSFAPPRPHTHGTYRKQTPEFNQQSVVVVYPGVRHGDAYTEDIEAFTSLFGGANSRCYWNIVQKGICSQAGAAWLAYQDCGVLALYADGEPDKAARMLSALREQAAEVSRHGFTADEVQRVKNQRRTQLALEGENPRTRLLQLIDDLEGHGDVRTTEQRLAAVEAVSVESIARYLNQFPITGEGMLLSVGPRDWPE